MTFSYRLYCLAEGNDFEKFRDQFEMEKYNDINSISHTNEHKTLFNAAIAGSLFDRSHEQSINRLKIIQFLIEQGSDIKTDEDRVTPLERLLRRELVLEHQKEILELLMLHTDANYRNNPQNNAMLAAINNYSIDKSFFEEFLKTFNFDKNAVLFQIYNSIRSSEDKLGLIQLFLDHGANINATCLDRNSQSVTLLDIAKNENDTALIKLLKQHKPTASTETIDAPSEEITISTASSPQNQLSKNHFVEFKSDIWINHAIKDVVGKLSGFKLRLCLKKEDYQNTEIQQKIEDILQQEKYNILTYKKINLQEVSNIPEKERKPLDRYVEHGQYTIYMTTPNHVITFNDIKNYFDLIVELERELHSNNIFPSSIAKSDTLLSQFVAGRYDNERGSNKITLIEEGDKVSALTDYQASSSDLFVKKLKQAQNESVPFKLMVSLTKLKSHIDELETTSFSGFKTARQLKATAIRHFFSELKQKDTFLETREFLIAQLNTNYFSEYTGLKRFGKTKSNRMLEEILSSLDQPELRPLRKYADELGKSKTLGDRNKSVRIHEILDSVIDKPPQQILSQLQNLVQRGDPILNTHRNASLFPKITKSVSLLMEAVSNMKKNPIVTGSVTGNLTTNNRHQLGF